MGSPSDTGKAKPQTVLDTFLTTDPINPKAVGDNTRRAWKHEIGLWIKDGLDCLLRRPGGTYAICS